MLYSLVKFLSHIFIFALQAARVNACDAVGDVKVRKIIAKIHFTPAVLNPIINKVPSNMQQVPNVTHFVEACRRL